MASRVARRPSSAFAGRRRATSAATTVALDPLRLERRRAVRIPTDGDLVVTFRDPAGGRVGLTRAQLVDASDGGLGILTPVRIEEGMAVTIRDASSRHPWSDAVAVRCTPDADADHPGQYRVGLCLARRMAA